MSRRKKQESHVNHERWLVSYADFITLLFAVFVVMYAASQTDQKKIGKLSAAIQIAFQDLGLFQPSDTHAPLSQAEPVPFSDAQMIDNIDRSISFGTIAPNIAATPGLHNRSTEDDLKQKLVGALSGEIANKKVELRETPDGLVLSLHEMGFYAPGSDILIETSQGTLDKIGEILAPSGLNVRIEGHTDNVPIHNLRFGSNWELSAARATGLVRMFVEKYRFAPARLSASGYGEYHPVEPNDTSDGRARNRRVDLVILTGAGRQAQTLTSETKARLGEVTPVVPGKPQVVSPTR